MELRKKKRDNKRMYCTYKEYSKDYVSRDSLIHKWNGKKAERKGGGGNVNACARVCVISLHVCRNDLLDNGHS